MFEDCGRKERERKKREEGDTHTTARCEDEGDRGGSGGEGQKDGELKEAGKDAGGGRGGGDRMTLGGNIKKTDQDVSWDFAGIFSNRNLDFKALRMCGLCSASQPRLTFR